MLKKLDGMDFIVVSIYPNSKLSPKKKKKTLEDLKILEC
jgi:hypothetical protein